MADAPERQMSWAVPRVLGRGVVALLSAPPGLGKGWWTWGLLRAMQDGEHFFGLRVTRPFTAPRTVARWFGSAPTPLKVLWLTEEGESFGETAKRFGIAPGLVTVLQRHEVRTTDWPAIVARVTREAFRRGCAYVIVDTIRAWCPQAEQSNDHAAAVFNLARREWAARGLGVLFVHHDRKGGGDFGEGVAGPNNLVGSCDVLIELRRVLGDATARRMLVSRRYGDQDVTARLVGHRYVVADAEEAEPDDEEGDALPAVPAHLQATLDALRQAGAAGMTADALQVAMVVAGTTALRRLAALEGIGLAVPQGTGVKGAPRVWRAVEKPPPPGPPPTADPAYRRYLNSQAWAAKRGEILARADGECEECGAGLGPGEAEVHHLSYERVGRELPEDLVALCPGCHRRAHP
jgi:AAA domain/HNH endonuclease